MRKIMVLLMAVAFIFGLTTSAMALPFDSIGWVDPSYGDSWNVDSATGTARYGFYWDNPNVTVYELDLQFEGDIFDLSALDSGDFNIAAPAGWSTFIYAENGNLHWSISGGTGIDYTQDPILLDVNYTLIAPNRYYFGNNVAAGDSESWAWNESQGISGPWVQKYILLGSGTIFSNNPGEPITVPFVSGGSTAPVPEPASLLLLGSGLVGLALFGRNKRKRI